MATRKAAGTAKNLRDSNPKYLGVKKYDGQVVIPGNIIVRQRGSRIIAGKGTKYGTDYTVYAVEEGKVKYSDRKMKHFDGSMKTKKVASVILK